MISKKNVLYQEILRHQTHKKDQHPHETEILLIGEALLIGETLLKTQGNPAINTWFFIVSITMSSKFIEHIEILWK